MKIGILVDSSSGILTQDLVGTNIDLINLHIIKQDEEDFIDTPENVEKHKVFDAIKNNEKISTSQASPGELMVKYDEMLGKYDHIIHITITPNLSSMHATAYGVANAPEYNGKVSVWDHGLAANVIKSLVFKFNDMINNNVTDITLFEKELRLWEKKTLVVIVPGDLSKLAKSGRGKAVLLALMKMFKTKVAIHWCGKPKKIAMGRTVASVLEKVAQYFKKSLGNHLKITFLHTQETSNKIITQIKNVMSENKIEFDTDIVPPIYACHAGVDTIGFVAYDEKLFKK